MERGPRVAMTISKPMPSARSVESRLSFRITTPKTEVFTSIKTGKELQFVKFTLPKQPSITEGSVKTPRFFEKTVPFIAPIMDAPKTSDPKPAPTKLQYSTYRRPKPVVEARNFVKTDIQTFEKLAQTTSAGSKVAETKVKPYFPERFVTYPTPLVKKKDEASKSQQVSDTTTQRIAAVRQELRMLSKEKTEPKRTVMSATPTTTESVVKAIELTSQKSQELGVTDVKIAEQATEITKQPEKIKKTLEKVTINKKDSVPTNKTKKNDNEKKPEDKQSDEKMKFIVDKRAKFIRSVMTIKAALPLLMWGMFSNDSQFSGEDLKLPDSPPSKALAKAAVKLRIEDPSWVIWVAKVKKIPKTSFGNLLATALQAIDEVPPVDVKPLSKVKGEKEAPASAILLLFGLQQNSSVE